MDPPYSGTTSPAGSAPSSANWFYDLGTDSGNQEVNRNTSSASNVALDGKGHLVIKAINSGGSWTSGAIESTRDDFQAPPGGEMEITGSLEQPDPANGLGVLAGVLGPRVARAVGRRPGPRRRV